MPAGDAIDEVRVGDETTSERNGVTAPLGEGLVRLSRLVTVVDDQRTREPLPTQCLVVDRPCRQTERVAVREPERIKRSQQGAECLLRIVVVEIVVGVAGTDPEADAVCAVDVRHGARYLNEEADPAGDRPSPVIVAMVRSGRQELGRQVAAGAMELHAIEAGLEREFRAAHIVGDHGGDLVAVKGPRGIAGLHGAAVDVGVHPQTSSDSRGRNRLGIGRLVGRHRDPADVHHLHHDRATLGMNRLSDPSPPGGVVAAHQPRRSAIALAVLGRIHALGDDHPGAGSLTVVLDHDVGDRSVGGRSCAGHRRHHDAISEFDPTEPGRRHEVDESGVAVGGGHRAISASIRAAISSGLSPWIECPAPSTTT